jgi:RNA polymerase sigma-70 factor (ECF subfamily)
MTTDTAETGDLITRARSGDDVARNRLLDICRMVDARLDRRVRVRVDASDIVQDTLVDAWRRMDDYLEGCPLPFLAWLRQIAQERMIDTRRRHVLSQRRDITRELSDIRLADDSSPTALEYLFADDSGPERHLDRQELEEQLQEAIHSLPSKDREVLLMRYFDQRGFAEIADTLCITRGAVKARLVRALIRLRGVLELAD